MSSIDLHLHSLYSDDGQLIPTELVEMCLKTGVRYAALTDHNSVKGVQEAIQASRWKDIEIIPAIELDCMFKGVNLHILGYGIDYANPVFDENEAAIIRQEQHASKTRMRLIREAGIDFEDRVIASLTKNGVVTGEMIAEAAMLFDTEHKNPLLQPYYEGGNRSDNPYVNFYWDFCHQGKAGYAEIKYISLQEAVRMIVENQGVPILAHPGIMLKEDRGSLEEINANGIAGIEVYSSYHSIEQTRFYYEFAESHHMLITCGSDFHGKIKPMISVGSTQCEERELEIIQALKQAIRSRSKIKGI
jgi:predicted metal-dependent phosphoesterase TrpH